MAKAKLLVVEDEPNLLFGIRDILELDEYDVMIARNGQQALDVLRSEENALPDLIVSDITMPLMDGFELLEEVRREEAWAALPFIFLTARDEKENVLKSKKLGGDDYLVKPFETDELLVTVESKLIRHGVLEKIHSKGIESVKRRILTILNHEFRTPLTLVVAYADMLKENRIEDMDADELLLFLREINTGADRLRRLIENFILVVELETGDAEKTYTWRKGAIHDLPTLIHAAHNQVFEPESVLHTCQVDLSDDLPPIEGDREYLVAILREMLDNAIKFSDPANPIHLEAEAGAESVVISVADEGRGIPPEELENIWQIFYQIDREQHEDQGAGSGLAIVKGFADLHNAQLAVETTPGEGSCFRLILPTLNDEETE